MVLRGCEKIVASEGKSRSAGAQEPECILRYMRIPSTAGTRDPERSRFFHKLLVKGCPYYTDTAAIEEAVITSLWLEIMEFDRRDAIGKKESIGADHSQILREPEGTPRAQ